MSKASEETVEQESVSEFQKAYEELKGKIIDGAISVKETRELYDACNTVKGGDAEKRVAIAGVIEDLEKSGITHEKYHDFVSNLVKVETQVVSERFPIDPTQSPSEQEADMKKRCAQYMRNTSLAKNAMLHECTKNGLGHDIYKDLKKNNIEAATKKFQEFEIPDYLQDHYSTIGQFYKENGNAQGAATNLTFHALTTSINEYAKVELTGNDVNNIIRTSGKTCKSVYSPSIPGSRDRLMDQIPGPDENVSVNFSNITPPDLKGPKPSFVERITNAFKAIKEAVQNLGQTIQNFVEAIFQKSDTPSKSETTPPQHNTPKPEKTEPDQNITKEQTVSVSRPRTNAIISGPKTDPSIKAAAENVRKNVASGKETGASTKNTPTTAISASKKQEQNKGTSR